MIFTFGHLNELVTDNAIALHSRPGAHAENQRLEAFLFTSVFNVNGAEAAQCWCYHQETVM